MAPHPHSGDQRGTGWAILFIALSYLSSLAQVYILSSSQQAPGLLDALSLTIQAVWLGVLAWVAWDIHKRKRGSKLTLLMLAGLVALLSSFDLAQEPLPIALLAADAAEALCLLASYWCVRMPRGRKERPQ
jgi:hypothetical protein